MHSLYLITLIIGSLGFFGNTTEVTLANLVTFFNMTIDLSGDGYSTI